ncbi:hypothetical protein [Paraburkholderia hospita]|jgi:hypothetical protein|uniref:hypothetical protein n=1 Tax=Paraburkholderia hospita TaxID=169430 RepID=UPI00027171CF|nr:hypothetical protein [Paraburkholderia hospita]EUC12462.1 hypothetical protein PMI06_008603 [Burkholderia sp. BT03]SKC50073.1 hypothetical protein SAMN06266956_0325 [Paraburkholderia hospita]SKD05360.1 hypothetical protein SAMN05446934_9598 [Paraburkholderia hospita]
MADRLTVQEFFDALRAQKISSLIDTPAMRVSVDRRVRALCASYPIQERWPVLDLESAYQQALNELPNVQDLVRDGYTGTVNLRGYDGTYTMDEWFGDFAGQWVLNDTPHIRATMLEQLSAGRTWKSPELWDAYKKAIRTSRDSWLRRLMGRH